MFNQCSLCLHPLGKFSEISGKKSGSVLPQTSVQNTSVQKKILYTKYTMTSTHSTRVRAWCFTCNNYTNEDIVNVKALEHKYLIVAKEIGETGTPHLQGYLELPNGKTLKALKKRLPRFHLEPRKGTSKEASDYCKKDDDYEELGELSEQGKRNDIHVIATAVASGKSFEDILDTVATSYQSLQVAKVIFPYKEPKRDWMPEIYWYWGAPGTGKTHAAYHSFPDLRRHIQNPKIKWYDGYDRHEVVIYDDLRITDIPYSTLLHILDKYPFTVETKHGTRQFVPTKIFITCPDHPEYFFRNSGENNLQMMRRFTEIREFDKYYVDVVQIDDADSHSSAQVHEEFQA